MLFHFQYICCLIVPCLIEVVKGGAGYSSVARGSMMSKWEWVDILAVSLIPLSKLVLN